MNLQKFTQKSLEAIQTPSRMQLNNGELTSWISSICCWLCSSRRMAWIPGLLQKMNINVNGLDGRGWRMR